MRASCCALLAWLCLVASACPRSDDDGALDAGAVLVVDAGAVDVHARADAGTVDPLPLVALTTQALGFRFVRLRTPTAGGEEIVRIGLHERVRLVDGVVVEERAAPSAEALARLVTQCARSDVLPALRLAGDTAPSMTIIELGCAPVQGVVACEAGASAAPASAATCAGAFAELRDAVTAAWQEDGEATRPPLEGLVVRTTSWEEAGAALRTSNRERAFVLYVDGKARLPAKGEPLSRAPKGKRSVVCADAAPSGCIEVIAPALVHFDVVGSAGRFRCPSCAPSANSPSSIGAVTGKTLSKADVLNVMKEAIPRVAKECARAAGPDIVKINWTIQPAGHVLNARDDGKSPTARGRCAASVIARLRFAASSTATPVSFPIKIGR